LGYPLYRCGRIDRMEYVYVQPGSSVKFLVSKVYSTWDVNTHRILHGQRAHGRRALAGCIKEVPLPVRKRYDAIAIRTSPRTVCALIKWKWICIQRWRTRLQCCRSKHTRSSRGSPTRSSSVRVSRPLSTFVSASARVPQRTLLLCRVKAEQPIANTPALMVAP